MSTSHDIESLFTRFGGDAERYHEVRAEADAEVARARWPLLCGVELRTNVSHGQPGSRSQDGGNSLRKIVAADIRALPAPEVGRRNQTPGPLKKLVGRPPASDRTDAQDPSQPLVRLFERLRAEATGAGLQKPSVWTGRS